MIYFLKVIFKGHSGENSKDSIYQIIGIQNNRSLSSLAKIIVSSFGFDFDHCYGFYDNLKRPFDSKEMYELFTDINEEPTEGALGVEHVRISRAFNKVGKKLLFLFDYGDNWYFTVELLEIKEIGGSAKYPKITKRVGKAPEQYPPLDDIEGDLENTLNPEWHKIKLVPRR